MLKTTFEILKYLKKKLIVNIYTNVYKTYRLLFTITQCHPRLLLPPPRLSILLPRQANTSPESYQKPTNEVSSDSLLTKSM